LMLGHRLRSFLIFLQLDGQGLTDTNRTHVTILGARGSGQSWAPCRSGTTAPTSDARVSSPGVMAGALSGMARAEALTPAVTPVSLSREMTSVGRVRAYGLIRTRRQPDLASRSHLQFGSRSYPRATRSS